jgi:hypothetical protein
MRPSGTSIHARLHLSRGALLGAISPIDIPIKPVEYTASASGTEGGLQQLLYQIWSRASQDSGQKNRLGYSQSSI